MTGVSVALVGAREVSLAFLTASVKTDAAVNKVVVHYGHLLATRVKAKASGRPGPNAPTGDYRRSINSQFSHSNGKSIAYVGTNAVQGRRLEYGFNGVDSIGRHYNQPPYAHFGPAIDEIEQEFYAALEKVVDLA
jgi:hypothetical protein